MLLFGDYNILGQMKGGKINKIYNFSSPVEIGVRLHSLIPSFSLYQVKDSKIFDIQYADYIMTNNAAFIDMMRIIHSIYNGENVFVLIGTNEISNFFTESLMKFIQQRYGYNGFIINHINDVFYASESDFSINGLYNLDQDRERYVLIEDPKYILEGMTLGNWEGV